MLSGSIYPSVAVCQFLVGPYRGLNRGEAIAVIRRHPIRRFRRLQVLINCDGIIALRQAEVSKLAAFCNVGGDPIGFISIGLGPSVGVLLVLYRLPVSTFRSRSWSGRAITSGHPPS